MSVFEEFVDKNFISYPNGKPNEEAETFVFKREPEGLYSTNGTKSHKNVYRVEGNKLVHIEHAFVTCTVDQGEFQWSHGYRSRLTDKQPVIQEPNHAMWDQFVDKNFESYPNGKPENVVETFWFRREQNGQFSTNGTSSNKNVYNVVGNTLVHVTYGHHVQCSLDNGEFQWSHGYRSRVNDNPPVEKEPKYELWNALVGQTFESYHKDMPVTVAELFDFKKETDDQYSTNGTQSHKNVYKVVGDRLVHVQHPVSASFEDGEFVWSHGYRSRPHVKQQQKPNYPQIWEQFVGKTFESFHESTPHTVIDTFVFKKETQVCFSIVNQSGATNYYVIEDDLLMNVANKEMTIKLTGQEFQWSTGYRSRVVELYKTIGKQPQDEIQKDGFSDGTQKIQE